MYQAARDIHHRGLAHRRPYLLSRFDLLRPLQPRRDSELGKGTLLRRKGRPIWTWFTLDRQKLAQSKADRWVFVLWALNALSTASSSSQISNNLALKRNRTMATFKAQGRPCGPDRRRAARCLRPTAWYGRSPARRRGLRS